VDWDWEMPVITVAFFSLGGFALAKPLNEVGPAQALSRRMRPLIGFGCILLAVAPTFVWLSQRKLTDADYAISLGNCAAASDAAVSSIGILGIRAEPYEILGYCDIRRGRPNLALASIQKAISLDPNNWNYQYDLAVIRAAAGLDPRAAARKALVLNPLEPLVRDAWQTFRPSNRRQWQGEGEAIANAFTTL
jgi:tetratricopeptide (TPR) repeat protein